MSDWAERSTVVSLEGRMYPVEVCYLKEPCLDYCEAAVQTVFDIHLKVSSAFVSHVLDHDSLLT
jgi:ATP-dependent RNA helicase DDX35